MRDKVLSLLDTNILVYATFNDLPQYSIAKELRDRAALRKLEAYLTPQILAEFYSIVTNPDRVGEGKRKSLRSCLGWSFVSFSLSQVIRRDLREDF